MNETPTAHLMCGLVAAGKSTYARRLAAERHAFYASLDAWMLQLHGIRFHEPEYAPLADRCRLQIWSAAEQVLRLGHDVVLDWNFWNPERRRAWKERIEAAGFGVLLHFVDVPLETAIARAAERAASGDPTSYRLTEADVRHHASIFVPPTDAEDISTTVIRSATPG
jgi:predicted kinase